LRSKPTQLPMPLFQTSVLKKYIAQQDKETAAKAFKKFSKYFGNTVIQQNIHDSKEEQFQEGFFRELFVNVFGFTLNPNPDYNLTTEFKNQKGAKKADGAILLNGDAIAVIELKGTKTKDLENVRQQAFDYKANQPECVYVITSNFEKLRFYINNAVEFEEFDLFHLTPDRFELLYLCLAQENLLSNLPLKIKEASIQEEEAITKKFYAAYSLFKRELFRDLVKNNVKNEVFRAELQTENIERATKNIKLNLFQKSQKLIDRFLFIFFAEDRGLLPPNSTILILEEWNKLRELDEIVPLYNRFKKYFNYLDLGRRETAKKAEIFAYNGGLFKPDTVLDSLIINDELIYKHTKALAGYDFESQVDVNILGHIFENSLNEIESVNAEIEGTEFDKQKTKRKKDGVFYTPKYITKYIVDNTVGKLCTDKKAELNMDETEFTPNRQKDTKKRLLDLLETYREWLLQLTILDPACGSGAFLNQALDFLIKEHQYIDELQTQLLGGGFVFPNIENTVLENNIYGVDLNEESVEIAKLSLWLRTAQPRRKLNDLSSNIKCGNSLIDSRSVAGNKAFHWQTEFSEIFKKGGFDVVIGNPPYVTRGISAGLKEALNQKFQTAQYQLDLYVSFMEQGINLLKQKGCISYIVPNSWLKNMMMSECRKFMLTSVNLQIIIPSLESVFPDASVDTMVFVAVKEERGNDLPILEFKNQEIFHRHNTTQERFWLNDGYIFDVEISEEILPIISKMKVNVEVVGSIFDVIRGINPYDKYTGQTQEVIKGRLYHADYKKDDTFFPELKGQHTARYGYNWDNKHFISYGDWLAAPRNIKYFTGSRIVFREILGRTLVSTLITEDFKIDRSLYIAKVEDEKKELYDIRYVLGILNSELMAFYFRYSNNEFDNLFPKIRVAEFKNLPIKNIEYSDQTVLANAVELMIVRNKEFITIATTFQTYVQSQFSIEKLSKKLQNWYELPFADFIKELNKAIKTSGGSPLSKLQEMDWMEVFETKKAAAQTLKTQINTTDQEIDQLVYQLYDLTEAEIKLVEEST
jgi:type I restriction-modification system DNA methylase subunit